MADTQHVRAKSREALHKALQRGGTKEGVSSDALVASVSLLAERVEAAMFEYYGRDLSLEHSHEGASAAEATPAEKLVTQHGDLVATEAYRQAVRAHVITLTSYNPRLAALCVSPFYSVPSRRYTDTTGRGGGEGIPLTPEPFLSLTVHPMQNWLTELWLCICGCMCLCAFSFQQAPRR